MTTELNQRMKNNDALDALEKVKYLVKAAQYLTSTDEETETQLELIDRISDLVDRVLGDKDE